MSRHRYNGVQDVWESFEWLLRKKLEEIDHMTREIYRDMQLAGVRRHDIDHFLPAAFAELWENVAQLQEEQKFNPRRKLS